MKCLHEGDNHPREYTNKFLRRTFLRALRRQLYRSLSADSSRVREIDAAVMQIYTTDMM